MLERKISTLEKIYVVSEQNTLSLTSISIYQNDSYILVYNLYLYTCIPHCHAGMEKLAKNKKYSSRISTYQIAHNLYLNGTLEYQKSTQIAFFCKFLTGGKLPKKL